MSVEASQDQNATPTLSAACGPVVCILGMHRSGTSCLAGCLQQAGLFLGDVNAAAIDNAKGNRENRAIQVLHDRLLEDNGGSWKDPPPAIRWTIDHANERDRIISTYPVNRVWGIKDPRMVFLLPFWREAIDKLKLVATFRHPGAVAHSLFERSTISEFHAVQDPVGLWLKYNKALLKLLKLHEFPLISFDWREDRYLDAVSLIAQSLNLESPLPNGAASFYDRSIRSYHGEDSGELEIPKEAIEVYHSLCAVSEHYLEA